MKKMPRQHDGITTQLAIVSLDISKENESAGAK
jgi:hypothetical protein